MSKPRRDPLRRGRGGLRRRHSTRRGSDADRHAPHGDHDNEVYNFVETGGEEDGPYTEDGEAVVDGKVTVVEETEEVTDVDVLNFALTLEHLGAAYYSEFLDEYSEREVETSGPARVLTGDGNDRHTVYQKIQTVRDHEEAHVEALTQTIEDLGGEPVEPLNYEVPYDSIEAFVALSATIEAVGVSAYAGAAPLIENDDLIPPALSVHSVEARHTSYFNVLNTTSPSPNAFDPARSMDEVLEIASQFIVGMNSEGGDKRMFTVTVKNVSKPGTVDTDRANGVVPLSPPAYGVYTGENPAFVPGEDANDGTELIAEDGFPGGPLPPESGGLADTLAESENVSGSGVASSPGGSIEAPTLGPGESVEFSVMARQKRRSPWKPCSSSRTTGSTASTASRCTKTANPSTATSPTTSDCTTPVPKRILRPVLARIKSPSRTRWRWTSAPPRTSRADPTR